MADLSYVLQNVKERNVAETEFHQAVEEVVESVWDFYEKHPRYQKAKIRL